MYSEARHLHFRISLQTITITINLKSLEILRQPFLTFWLLLIQEMVQPLTELTISQKCAFIPMIIIAIQTHTIKHGLQQLSIQICSCLLKHIKDQKSKIQKELSTQSIRNYF